jgi:pimeloyl-ACP methyl ester carboxylesterase
MQDLCYFAAQDGVQVRYIDIGAGKPLIFIHGFGSNAESSMPYFNLLKSRYRCITWDQRGCGQTAAKNPGLKQSAQDLKALIAHLQLEKAALLGYSMGGSVVFSYFDQFGPDHIDKVLIGDMTPKALNDSQWRLGLHQGNYFQKDYDNDIAMMKNNFTGFITYFVALCLIKSHPDDPREFSVKSWHRKLIVDAMGGNEALVDAMLNVPEHLQPGYIHYFRDIMDTDFREVLPTITVPAALIYSRPGSIYAPEAAAFMAEQIPNTVLYPFEDCTHMLRSEKPQQFIQTIDEFLGGI